MEADTVTADSTEEVSKVDAVESQEEQIVEEKQVPLTVLQKERKKRQEAELKNQWMEEKLSQISQSQKPQEEDETNWEAVTKGDLKNYSAHERHEIIRTIKEDDWQKNNADKIEIINEKLPELLKKKPHLASAIQNSTNRYEEAWDQLKGHEKVNAPKQAATRRENKAPGSPATLPKSAGVNQAVNLMDLSDSEFNEWRNKRKRRRG